MRPRLLVLFIGLASTMWGCNGEIRKRAWTPASVQQTMSSPDGIKGVFVYYEKGAIEIDLLTQVVDKTGAFVSTDCTPVSVQKTVTVADYDHPFQIWYNSGLLEANTFSVQMSSTVVTNINSSSTPDQGKTLSNLATAATSFAKIAAAAAPPGPVKRAPPKPNYNGRPSFHGYDPLTPIP